MHELFLTFDTEDFISSNSIPSLQFILEDLKKHELKAYFFITGHMAEKLRNFPAIVNLLDEHEIGYHSSSHSVRPRIYEFTDVKDYEQAYQTSLERETSHVNPISGNIEGRGGIYALKDLFPNKKIEAFRAPGNCWTPPHLEAMRSLGIHFDFSAALSPATVHFKDITFYPHSIIGHWEGRTTQYQVVSISLLRRRTTVIGLHPSLLFNREEWDSIFIKSNPKRLREPKSRNSDETRYLLSKSDALYTQISRLQSMKAIRVTPKLEKSHKKLEPTKDNVEKWYAASIVWAKKIGYRPRYLRDHFFKFFDVQ